MKVSQILGVGCAVCLVLYLEVNRWQIRSISSFKLYQIGNVSIDHEDEKHILVDIKSKKDIYLGNTRRVRELGDVSALIITPDI